MMAGQCHLPLALSLHHDSIPRRRRRVLSPVKWLVAVRTGGDVAFGIPPTVLLLQEMFGRALQASNRPRSQHMNAQLVGAGGG